MKNFVCAGEGIWPAAGFVFQFPSLAKPARSAWGSALEMRHAYRGFESLSRYQIAAKALNSIELDLLPLVTRDVTRLHLRVQFGNAGERRMFTPEVVERARTETLNHRVPGSSPGAPTTQS
jgi:hypothetical protein